MTPLRAALQQPAERMLQVRERLSEGGARGRAGEHRGGGEETRGTRAQARGFLLSGLGREWSLGARDRSQERDEAGRAACSDAGPGHGLSSEFPPLLGSLGLPVRDAGDRPWPGTGC